MRALFEGFQPGEERLGQGPGVQRPHFGVGGISGSPSRPVTPSVLLSSVLLVSLPLLVVLLRVPSKTAAAGESDSVSP